MAGLDFKRAKQEDWKAGKERNQAIAREHCLGINSETCDMGRVAKEDYWFVATGIEREWKQGNEGRPAIAEVELPRRCLI